MKLEHLQRSFQSMGARLQVEAPQSRQRLTGIPFSVDIRHDRQGQYFAVVAREPELAQVDFEVLQVQPRERHLLLFAKTDFGKRKDRFLCGHDEREWFVAAVPGSASTVLQAREALKPAPVRAIQARMGLNSQQANTRHNPAFRRQGEWFFVPVANSLVIDEKFILRHEPIRRTNGSPHVIDEVYRTGGELVHVSPRHPRGLTENQYQSLLKRRPDSKALPWTVMRRNPGVYARGAVRHRDHATIVLHTWHQVLMNTEHEAPTQRFVSFLD